MLERHDRTSTPGIDVTIDTQGVAYRFLPPTWYDNKRSNMRAPRGIELLSDGTLDCGSSGGSWSGGECGRGYGELCSCGGSCACGGCNKTMHGWALEVAASCLPDYDGEIWASTPSSMAFVDAALGGGHAPLFEEPEWSITTWWRDRVVQPRPDAPQEPLTRYQEFIEEDICGPDITKWLMGHLDAMRRKARLWAGTQGYLTRISLVAGAAVTPGQGQLNGAGQMQTANCPKGKCAGTASICGICFNNDLPEDLTFGVLYSNASVSRVLAHAGAHAFATASSLATSAVAVATLGGVGDVQVEIGDHEGAYPAWMSGESLTAEDMADKDKFCQKMAALAKQAGVVSHGDCGPCQDPPWAG